MDLYHSDIRLPDGFRTPVSTVAVKYSRHAERAAQNDRYGKIDLPTSLDLSTGKVIEVGVEGGKVVKVLFRFPYTRRCDLCIVLCPGRPAFCKTVWLNERTDKHVSLDRSKYVG